MAVQDGRGRPEGLVVDGSSLHLVGRRPTMIRYLGSLWRYRHFVMADSGSRIAGAQANNVLGRVWAVLNPLLDGLAYYLVFGLLLGTGRGVPNFVGYLIVGVFLFRFTSQAITAGSKAIASNQSIVRAFRFPRATLVVASNFKALREFAPTLVVMLVLILIIPPVEQLSWRWLLIIPLLAVQTLLNLGLSLILARVVAHVPDVSNLITFGTRIWLYLSAVFFSVERFADLPVVLNLMYLNPLYCVLEIARDSILYGVDADPARWGVLAAWTGVTLVVGAFVFWQAEETYGEAS